MIALKANIKKDFDASILVGRRAEVLDSCQGFAIGEEVIIKSVDVRTGSPNIQVTDVKGAKNGQFTHKQLYLLPQTSEEFDKEIERADELRTQLVRRKQFMDKTDAKVFDEGNFKIYNSIQEIRNASNDEELEVVVKRIMA